jgi:oligopeptide/dipeptide ABC transporter ATP-binding protein
MSVPVLEVSELNTSLRIDGELRPVVRDVGFTIAAGEIVALVGESGSGKSITARTVMRLLPRGAKSSGHVRLAGADVPLGGSALREVRARRMAVIFQDPRAHIDPLYRNGDHLTEGLERNGMSRASARGRALELLRSVGIQDAERVFASYPHQVSGGMLQRVMIAAALAGEPDVIIADEPTTALDVTTQAEIARLLDRLRRDVPRGVLFITHDLDLAAAICDRVLVMYAGRIVEEHRTRTLFRSPLHPYTAQLLAARPRIDVRMPRLPVIPGRAVSAFEAPQGCPFSDRCQYAEPRCREHESTLAPRTADGRTACLRIAEIESALEQAVAHV